MSDCCHSIMLAVQMQLQVPSLFSSHIPYIKPSDKIPSIYVVICLLVKVSRTIIWI